MRDMRFSSRIKEIQQRGGLGFGAEIKGYTHNDKLEDRVLADIFAQKEQLLIHRPTVWNSL